MQSVKIPKNTKRDIALHFIILKCNTPFGHYFPKSYVNRAIALRPILGKLGNARYC